MGEREARSGPYADVAGPEGAPDKEGASADPGYPQPEAAEVEGARLLANTARARLIGSGLPDEDVRRLADEFVAAGGEGDVAAFVSWVHERSRRSAQA